MFKIHNRNNKSAEIVCTDGDHVFASVGIPLKVNSKQNTITLQRELLLFQTNYF